MNSVLKKGYMNRLQPQSSRPKGKEAMVAGLALDQKPPNNQGSYKPCIEWTYTFKDEQTVTFFHLLTRKGMLKLSKNQKPKEVEKIDNSRYCLYHQTIGHTTKNCYILKDKI